MILSAALDEGYVFMTLIAILTSVIGAGYYLNLIKQMFFFKHNYEINPSIYNIDLIAYLTKYGHNESDSSLKVRKYNIQDKT